MARGALEDQARFIADLETHLFNLKAGADGFDVAADDVLRSEAMAETVARVHVAWNQADDAFCRAPAGKATRETIRDYARTVGELSTLHPIATGRKIRRQRSGAMDAAAKKRSAERGGWKIGMRT